MNRIIVRVGLAPPERTYFSSIIRYGGHVPGRIKNIFIHVDEQNRNKTRKNDPKYGPTTTRSTTMLMIIIIILLLFRLRTPRVLKFVTSPDVLFYDFFFCSVSKFFFYPIRPRLQAASRIPILLLLLLWSPSQILHGAARASRPRRRDKVEATSARTGAADGTRRRRDGPGVKDQCCEVFV